MKYLYPKYDNGMNIYIYIYKLFQVFIAYINIVFDNVDKLEEIIYT